MKLIVPKTFQKPKTKRTRGQCGRRGSSHSCPQRWRPCQQTREQGTGVETEGHDGWWAMKWVDAMKLRCRRWESSEESDGCHCKRERNGDKESSSNLGHDGVGDVFLELEALSQGGGGDGGVEGAVDEEESAKAFFLETTASVRFRTQCVELDKTSSDNPPTVWPCSRRLPCWAEGAMMTSRRASCGPPASCLRWDGVRLQAQFHGWSRGGHGRLGGWRSRWTCGRSSKWPCDGPNRERQCWEFQGCSVNGVVNIAEF